MKVFDFKYSKKDGSEDTYKLLVLNEDKEYLKGISLLKLKEDELKSLIEIQEDYEAKLKPFMKNYRQFIKENIIINE